MGTIKVGIVGAGTMGRAHAEAVRTRVSGATLTAVSDPDGPRATVLAGEDATAFANPIKLIESPDVDVVIVASPDDRHAEHVTACVEAGKPVLCEKPLAPTAAACRSLVALERDLNRRLIQVGYMRRFDAAYLDLKAAYDSGAVGKALLLRCVHRNAKAPGFFTGNMAISNAMVHEFDILRWLLGAEIARIRVDQPIRDGKRAGDPIVASLEMSAGQLVTIEVFMNAVYGYDIGTEIVGETGVLIMGKPPLTGRLSLTEPGTRVSPDYTIRFIDAYTRQIQYWVDAVATGRTVGASAVDGLRATLAADAGERALKSGQWEAVEA